MLRFRFCQTLSAASGDENHASTASGGFIGETGSGGAPLSLAKIFQQVFSEHTQYSGTPRQMAKTKRVWFIVSGAWKRNGQVG